MTRAPFSKTLLGCLAACLLAPHWGYGVEPPTTPKLTEACRAAWLSFSILSGRLTLTGTRFGSINSNSSGNGRSERLNIQIKASGPAVSYEMIGAADRLSVELSDGDQLLIQWQPQGNARIIPLEYHQVDGKPVSLKIGPDKQQKVLEASSLWHLMIAYPNESREYLVPLVRVFQTDLDPVAFSSELEAELLRHDSPLKPPSRQHWSELIQQLGDDQFSRRETADHELRKAGRLVVTYLSQLDLARLDAEQQYRVRRIIKSVSQPSGMDTPGSTAAWLTGDPAVWLSLLERDDVAVEQLALQRLGDLLGQPVTFDRTTDRQSRQRQLDQLRARFLTQ